MSDTKAKAEISRLLMLDLKPGDWVFRRRSKRSKHGNYYMFSSREDGSVWVTSEFTGGYCWTERQFLEHFEPMTPPDSVLKRWGRWRDDLDDFERLCAREE
jgi:hypothetical protein